MVSYVRSQVTRDSPVHASKSWQRIPPVPPSTPRQKIPSLLCGLVVVVVVVFMSAFFLSLSSLSLSLESLSSAWCLLLNGAKETGTHLTLTPEREREESLKHFKTTTQSTFKRVKKRVKSKFNKAVSAGMKAVRMSTSYGGKNKISDAKKAFTAVTKTASRINKGAKIAKSGIRRKIGLAVKRILK